MLGIIAPEKSYVEELLKNFNYEKIDSVLGTELFACKYNNHKFYVMTTGYGKVNIGSNLRYLFDKYKIKVLLQIGTAGSVDDKNEIFNVVIANNVLQFDVDFMPLGYSPAQLPLLKTGVFQANYDLVECLNEVCRKSGVNYTNDLIASSDMYVCNARLANSIRREYNAGAVDCECGCVGQFCYQNNIAFAGIKVISNFANNNSVRQYNTYDDAASKLVQKLTTLFIKDYYE